MTAEGEGKSDKKDEDLFEDLDKFFAPIQDVDWPETVSEEEERAGHEAPPEPQEAPEEERIELPDLSGIDQIDDLRDTGAIEEPVGLDEPAPAETPGQAGLFLGEHPEEGGWPEEEEEEDEDEGAASAVYETEPDISLESFRTPPSAYADLPGPDDEEDEEDVAAPMEGAPFEPEEEPSPEAVEAAADHFAESILLETPSEAKPGRERGLPHPFDLPEEPEAVEGALLAELDESAEGPRSVRVGEAEGLGGPSWQEPTSIEVGADQERGRVSRDVPAAFLTGIVLAGLAVGSIAIGIGPFAIVAGAMVLMGQGELYGVMLKRHYQPATALGLASGGLILGAAYFRGESAMLSMLALSTFATFIWFMAMTAAHRKRTLGNVGATLLGVVYVPLLAGYGLTMLRLPDGRALTLSVIGLTFAYDTAAFVVGYFWGSRPLAPTVSPKKSWEGAIGATLVVIAVSVGIVASSVDLLSSVGDSVGLAVVVAIFAPLGDLAESLLKRDLGVKDMGSILPGHGGVLDRIDSVLFVAPAAFMFLRLILL
ncbi:MAG: phosphatidate cytidylyltransferase [Actinomycetota bacterium]